MGAPKGNKFAVGKGRPFTYKPEYADILEEYLKAKEEPYELYTPENGTPKMIPTKIPTVYAISGLIGVPVPTIREWANNEQLHKRHPELLKFSTLINKLSTKRTEFLMENGLNGSYSASFAKMAAANWLGWSDKVDNRLSGEVTSSIIRLPAKKAVGDEPGGCDDGE